MTSKAERVTLEEVLPFRVAHLRPPGFRPEAKPGDAHPLAAHFVARGEGGRILACATVHPEGPPGHWQLRAVATAPEAQRQGAGRAVVEACLAHARGHGATLVWCHGRTGARAFYEALGFRVLGEEYVLPVSGPHYRMEREP